MRKYYIKLFDYTLLFEYNHQTKRIYFDKMMLNI